MVFRCCWTTEKLRSFQISRSRVRSFISSHSFPFPLLAPFPSSCAYYLFFTASQDTSSHACESHSRYQSPIVLLLPQVIHLCIERPPLRGISSLWLASVAIQLRDAMMAADSVSRPEASGRFWIVVREGWFIRNRRTQRKWIRAVNEGVLASGNMKDLTTIVKNGKLLGRRQVIRCGCQFTMTTMLRIG